MPETAVNAKPGSIGQIDDTNLLGCYAVERTIMRGPLNKNVCQ
jgi:hypothetical protein